VTVRDVDGIVIVREHKKLSSVRSYIFFGRDLIDVISPKKEFFGSVEFEFMSELDMVYPYPAISFALECDKGISVVHSTGRAYNDTMDEYLNSVYPVPEAGFDLVCSAHTKSYFIFVNGKTRQKQSNLVIEYKAEDGRTWEVNQCIQMVEPYELKFIEFVMPNDVVNCESPCVLTASIRHSYVGFFPRFIVCNKIGDWDFVSLTHTYYDSRCDRSVDSSHQSSDKSKCWDAVATVPFDSSYQEVSLAVYPISSCHDYRIDLQLLDEEGVILDARENHLKIRGDQQNLRYIRLSEIFKCDSSAGKRGAVKVMLAGSPAIPARVKFGLNIRSKFPRLGAASNVCFNAINSLGTDPQKPKSFRWSPIFTPVGQRIFLHNTSFEKNYAKTATIKATVWCNIPDLSYTQTFQISPNGTLEFIDKYRVFLIDFLKNSIGWVTFESDSPFLTGFYIIDMGRGCIGADHIF
jgi:hypothetical protein